MKITRLAVPLLLILVANPTVLMAQFGQITNFFGMSRSVPRGHSPSSLARLAATKAGGPITSKFVDPFMTHEQAEKLFEFLNRPYQFDWGHQTTPKDLQRDLSAHLSVAVDQRALEEIGLTSDVEFGIDIPNSGAKKRKPKANDDPFASGPFAENSESKSQTLAVKATDAAKPANHRWWRETSSLTSLSADAKRVTNGARLLYCLDQLDLTLNVHHGQLVITTVEAAEQNCCIRLFDVTPLVKYTVDSSEPDLDLFGYQGSDSDYQSLIDLIHTTVEPDTWEALGGPSTIASFSTGSRRWLVVTTPLVQHWQIGALLEQLNQ